MQRETNFEGTPAATPSLASTEASAGRDMLRFLTCGSVDDGKSTLIGRLLYDSQMVLEDQMAALSADSKQVGTTGGDIDFALLVDGLQAEREQGITIDVAYRYFATQRRKFIVADTPGHEQYTRNMATGASNCDLAVILVDARKGILSQTRRHSIIAHLLGIRHVVLAVNKMDLAGHSQSRFDAIVEDYLSFSRRVGITGIVAIPVVATSGDNILAASTAMPWYSGPTLMAHLETVDVSRQAGGRPLRLPVQWVNRPDLNFRGFSGSVTSGSLHVGDAITVLPSARPSKVSRIVGTGGDWNDAAEGDAVTVVLADEVDVSRGDVIVAPEDRPEVADQVAADIVWMGDEPMFPGRPYWVRCGTQGATATVTALKYKLNVDNLDHIAGRQLELNEIAMCNLSFSRPMVFEPYEIDRAMGSFILIDRITNATVAAGMIRFGLRRATNVHWQALAIDRATRAAQKNQSPACLWFTGLSGSGKSTIANLLEKRLHACGNHTFILDGDNVRHGLNKDLGFTDTDRVENIRRVGEMAKLMTEAGLIVLVSFISPFREERRLARELFQDGEFLEIFVDAPLQACEERDPKGLYKKARAGQIRNFTGIDSAYERPEHAEMRLATAERPAEDLVEDIITELRRRGIIGVNQQ